MTEYEIIEKCIEILNERKLKALKMFFDKFENKTLTDDEREKVCQTIRKTDKQLNDITRLSIEEGVL